LQARNNSLISNLGLAAELSLKKAKLYVWRKTLRRALKENGIDTYFARALWPGKIDVIGSFGVKPGCTGNYKKKLIFSWV
jgi:hypothetical protein